ncbi:YihY/virulence factor BrkB family protein [Aeromicrobium sp. NPDC092404]|uniref:YihY/virulence factor BrkB family protein n=1 Tax=Aeromicrobium sp. NPDC092404 TaxID=3154976 RepID=UPI00342C2FAD
MTSRLASVKTAWKQGSARQAPLLAAGVAFYAFLSLFPAMIAAIMTYGLVASPETVAKQSSDIAEALPADAASVVTGQMDALIGTSTDSLGLGLAIALVLAIYGAAGGVGNLITAINAMFGLAETRSFIKRKALALLLTLGAIVFVVLVVGLVAVAPAVLDKVDIVPGVRAAFEAGRWILLLAAVTVGIGILFRLAPNRTPRSPLVSKGVLVATALWLLVSVGFSLYVDNFGSYGKTYGALAGVVVLLLWLWIGLFAILLGACVEAVREEVVTEETVEEDSEIAEWRTAEVEGETVPAEVVHEPEPTPEPTSRLRSLFTRKTRRR